MRRPAGSCSPIPALNARPQRMLRPAHSAHAWAEPGQATAWEIWGKHERSNGMTQHRDGGSRAGGRTANEMTGRLPPSHAPRTCSTPRQEFLASRGGRKGRRLSRVQTAKAASFSWAGRKNEDTRRGLGATTRQADF